MTKDKEDLVLNNLGLVYYVVNSFKHVNIPREDLISIGTIGLLKAAKTFDLSKTSSFSTYAIPCIRNQILMGVRKIKSEAIVISIDEMVNSEEDAFNLLEILGSDDEELQNLEVKSALSIAFQSLSNEEKQVLNLHYGLNGNTPQHQSTIAKSLKKSQAYISRIEKRAIIKLRRELL